MKALRGTMSEVKHRLATPKTSVFKAAETGMNHYISVAMRLDRLDGRMNRVERRLDIVPA